MAFIFSRIQLKIPQRVLIPLLLFFVMFSIASFQDKNPLFEISKVGTSILVFLFFASAVNTDRDFRWMSWGLLIVAVVIGVMGVYEGESHGAVQRLSGINVLEGLGNKNAQSLYTLPGLFFGTNLFLRYLRMRKWILVLIIVISIFFIIVGIFLSANRSGWLGLAIIFFSYMVFSGFEMRTIFLGGLLMLFAYVSVDYYASDIYDRKQKQTVEGFASDEGRKILILESLRVGWENPLLGVGYDELHAEMARRLGVARFGKKKMDTHFLFGYIFGASGIFSLAFFIFFLIGMTRALPRPLGMAPLEKKNMDKIRILLISFILLYISRSLFTREILYSPTFMAGMGLIYGYYVRRSKFSVSAVLISKK
ncbi:MAG: O-antigen ligase family protein [Cytophagales bacterium]|nr:O-antigen ligase family protein [Cytophagales bacterium]